MRNLKELKIRNKAIESATEVYHLTAEFPAEGAGWNTNKEFCYFLGISNRSSYELQTQLIISRNLDPIDARVEPVPDRINEIQKMNYTFQKMLTGGQIKSLLISHI